jgi:SAM-dependent methyltransferase
VIQPLSINAWLRWAGVRRLLPSEAKTVLEIGAGLGGMGAMLARRFEYVGLEPDSVSHAIALKRIPAQIRKERLEDHDGVYDLICAFEVLEHIEDDVDALRLWREHSRQWLLLSVPMNQDRFGPWDERAGHFRRYSRATLSRALTEAGWELRAACAYGFPAGYVLEAARNLIARRGNGSATMSERTGASGRTLQPGPALAHSTWAISLPLRVVQRPFMDTNLGIGLVALAHRTGGDAGQLDGAH